MLCSSKIIWAFAFCVKFAISFSGFSVGFCINEEKGYLLTNFISENNLPTFQLNAPVVITFALITTGGFSRNVGKFFSELFSSFAIPV